MKRTVYIVEDNSSVREALVMLIEEQAPDYFQELRRLQEGAYREDPLDWGRQPARPSRPSTPVASLFA